MAKEFEKLKEALKEEPTPEARKKAAEAFKRYRVVELAKNKRQSKPALVSLAFGKKYPTAIDINDIPDELERNPEFFKHMRDIIAAEKD